MQSLKNWLHVFNDTRKLHKNYKGYDCGERLGEAFCNDFIKQSWPELYYCQDDEKSLALIVDYLVDCQYYPNVPDKLEKKNV